MTRNCRAAIEKAFPDMDVYVNAVATREDVSAVKPHPAHVMALLGLLGHIDPGKALLVGDHPTDVLAGKASGVASVGVLTGRTARSAFTQAGATFVVNDIRDVPALIDEWQGQAMGKG